MRFMNKSKKILGRKFSAPEKFINFSRKEFLIIFLIFIFLIGFVSALNMKTFTSFVQPLWNPFSWFERIDIRLGPDNCFSPCACGWGCDTDACSCVNNPLGAAVCGKSCNINNSVVLNCVPSCFGKNCGDDGCGGVCGTCSNGTVCTGGICSITPLSCIASCEGKICGDDGCGGVCGTCSNGDCVNGNCIIFPPSTCNTPCPVGQICDNGDCRSCRPGEDCCRPQCGGLSLFNAKQCGDDGCGGSCGSCPQGYNCNEGICVIDPCIGKCGGSCGDCGYGQVCKEGICCTLKRNQCGDDGCGGTQRCPTGYFCDEFNGGTCCYMTYPAKVCCDSKPKTCEDLPQGQCGYISDGCHKLTPFCNKCPKDYVCKSGSNYNYLCVPRLAKQSILTSIENSFFEDSKVSKEEIAKEILDWINS